MKCQGTTKSGRRCQKRVEDGFCSQHESQRPEIQPCDRCGPEKGAVQEVLGVNLCLSCSVAHLRLNLEFVGADDIDQKILAFRENF